MSFFKNAHFQANFVIKVLIKFDNIVAFVLRLV